MQDTNKAITSLVRSMKRTLKDKHGVDIAHSALRASYLQALGENPHAFAGREQAPVIPEKAPPPVAPVVVPRADESLWRTLYLAEDNLGCLERFSLFDDGTVLLPEGFQFKNATLERQFAEIPRISRYGLPDHLVKAKEFYAPHGLEVGHYHEFWPEDLGDDGAGSCKLVISMPDADWEKLLDAALVENPGFENEVAEWVGMHYQRLFNKESPAKQLEWVQRYLDMLEESARMDAERQDDE